MDNQGKAKRTSSETRTPARLDYMKEVQMERETHVKNLLDFYAGTQEEHIRSARRRHPWLWFKSLLRSLVGWFRN